MGYKRKCKIYSGLLLLVAFSINTYIQAQSNKVTSKLRFSAYANLSTFTMPSFNKLFPEGYHNMPIYENMNYKEGQLFILQRKTSNLKISPKRSSICYNLGLNISYPIAQKIWLNYGLDIGIQNYYFNNEDVTFTIDTIGVLEVLKSGTHTSIEPLSYNIIYNENQLINDILLPLGGSSYNLNNRISVELEMTNNLAIQVGFNFGTQFFQSISGMKYRANIGRSTFSRKELNEDLYGYFGSLNYKFGKRHAISLFYQKALSNLLYSKNLLFENSQPVFPVNIGVKYAFYFGKKGSGLRRSPKEAV